MVSTIIVICNENFKIQTQCIHTDPLFLLLLLSSFFILSQRDDMNIHTIFLQKNNIRTHSRKIIKYPLSKKRFINDNQISGTIFSIKKKYDETLYIYTKTSRNNQIK